MASWNLEGLTISELNDLAKQCQAEADKRKKDEAKNAAREVIAALDKFQDEFGKIEFNIHHDVTTLDVDGEEWRASEIINKISLYQAYWSFNNNNLILSLELE